MVVGNRLFAEERVLLIDLKLNKEERERETTEKREKETKYFEKNSKTTNSKDLYFLWLIIKFSYFFSFLKKNPFPFRITWWKALPQFLFSVVILP